MSLREETHAKPSLSSWLRSKLNTLSLSVLTVLAEGAQPDLSAGANLSENVAAFASLAALREVAISAEHPTVATASKTTPKIRVRILPSFMGVAAEDGAPLFQDLFVPSENGFAQRPVIGLPRSDRRRGVPNPAASFSARPATRSTAD
jgi:hypothetical protein